jgi:hypothetical protein
MPLMRGQVVGYDPSRMMFEFTMVSTIATSVVCRISSAALDELTGQKGTRPADRETQFMGLRDIIERIASDIFDFVPDDLDDRDVAPGSAVQIFAKHIRQL